VRDRYQILEYALTEDGICSLCGTKLAGHFDKFEGEFGGRRIPLRINNR
jgi:pyruvate formate lyase activating enzyme